ncbi:MAG: hypothetical protein HKO93_00490, partial [Flavobacteriales bacterium]|nr:hypothetical protein [Flavobacteriales bacterium]
MSFQRTSSKAYELFIGLALVGLTVFPKSVPGWLGLALVFGLLENEYIGLTAWKKLSRIALISLILPIVFFSIHLLGMIHTEDVDLGWKDVFRKITLIAVPIFLILKGIDQDRLSKWMSYFLVGIFFSLVWNNIQSYMNYAETGKSWYFFGEHGVSQMHLGYYTLHLLVGIGVVVQRIFKYHLKNRNFAYGLGILALYIIVNLILTGSKMGFLTLLAMLGVSFFLMLSRGIGWKRILISVVIISVLLIALVKQTSFLAERFERMTVETPI